MARRLRTAVTMLSLIALLVAAGYYGWLGLTEGWTSGTATEQPTAQQTPGQTCTTPPPKIVRSRQLRVSVYNAGAPSGQATAVMEALTEQGFRQAELGDAPAGITVGGIVLWPGNADRDVVRLLRRQFPEVRLAPRREPLGPGVNVMVGEEFGGLRADAPRRIRITQPEQCGPSAG